MKSRWFSPRALLLHLALVVWFTGCVAAAVWQVSRAVDGNALSYLYAVLWPLFAIGGVFGWWALVHLDEVTEVQAAERRAFEESMRVEAQLARRQNLEPEDPQLAAYNDHLAAVGRRPKKRLVGH